jgi:polar amino acid transport system substrate-binding protein
VGDPDLYRISSTRLSPKMGLSRRTVLTGLAVIAAGPVYAQVDTGSPGDTLDEIVARGTIKIGVYEDYAPYSYIVDGKPAGTDVDIAELIAKALGVKAEVELRRADESVDADMRSHVWRGPLAEQGKVVNVMLHMPIDRELALRNEMVVMGGGYASEKTVLTWSKSQLGDIPTMTDFTEYKIAVENDSIADFYLGGIAGGGIVKNMLHQPNMANAMELLITGEAAGAMGPMAQIEHALFKLGDHKQNFGVGQTVPAGLSQGTWTYGFAVRMNYRDLYYAVEQALADAVADGRMKAIFERHGLTYNPPPPPREE